MKTRLFIKSCPIFLLVAAGIATSACGSADFGFGTGPSFDDPTCPQPLPTAASVRLNTNAVVLRVGETQYLSADVKAVGGSSPCPLSPTWTSSDPQIVTVFNGAITGMKDGSAWIKASVDLVADSAFVTVSTPKVGAVWGILPSSLLVGQTASMVVKVEDTSGAPLIGMPATFSSADTSKATVSTTGMVIAKREGTVDITVRVQNVTGSWRLKITRDAPSVRFTAISAGGSHTCGIASGGGLADGNLVCWGDGRAGQLGDSRFEFAYTPVVANLPGVSFSAVSAGEYHTCALSTAGSAYCWGANQLGQLGDGSTTLRAVPTPVQGSMKFIQIAAGQNHSCGLTQDGSVYCWGTINGETSRSPIRIDGFPKILQISAEALMVCALSGNGEVFCLGKSFDLFIHVSYSKPTRVSNGMSFASIASGRYHTCGLTSDGAAYCWGLNTASQIDPVLGDVVSQPRPLPGGFTFSSIDPGGSTTCGITGTGARCIGATLLNNSLNGYAKSLLEIPREPEHPFKAISAGGSHTCAIDDKGGVWCWGDQRLGAVGAGEGIPIDEPLQVRVEP